MAIEHQGNTTYFRTGSILFLLLSSLCRVSYSVYVCTGEKAGYPLIPRAVPVTFNRDYILLEAGKIQCTGVISEWVYYKQETVCDNVIFNVWRPTTGNRYTLVGRNVHEAQFCQSSPAQNQAITFHVGETNRIPVQAGDLIGWTQSSNPTGMIRGEVDNILEGGPIRWRNPCNVNPGGNCNFGQSGQGSNLFGVASLQAKLILGPPPTIDNLPNVMNISENWDPIARPTLFRFEIGASHKMIHSGVYRNIMPNPITMTVKVGVGEDARGNGRFYVNTANNRFFLQSRRTVDYERRQQYIIPITVEAMGHTVVSNMTVNVLDMNEPHTITNLPTTRSVTALNAPPGKEIFKVEVIDEDIYNPSKIYYAIGPFTTTDVRSASSQGNGTDSYIPDSLNLKPRHPFQMDENTGIVSTNMDLIEFEYPGATQATFALTIIASDGQYEITDTLSITITNLRQPPAFINLPSTVNILENAPGDDEIFKVVAKGADPPSLRFSLVTVNPITKKSKFTVDTVSGVVHLVPLPEFDFMDIDGRTFTISIAVGDGYLTETIGVLTVNIGWVNQNPTYVPDRYFITLPEKCGDVYNRCQDNANAPGLPWWPSPDTMAPTILNALDRDVQNRLPPGQLDRLTCSIQTGLYSNYFITPNTANCRTLEINRQLDVNADPGQVSINLTVKADDRFAGSTVAQIFITVYDINDHVPRFNPGSYRGQVNENTKGGLPILTVFATDNDWNANAEIRFSIVRTNGPLAGYLYFEVDPDTGVISTKQPVDYEALPVGRKFISFAVEARDRGTPSRASQAQVIIDILDVNDNFPEWQCLNREEEEQYPPWDDQCLYNTELRHDTLIGYSVLAIGASDVDTVSPNVTYYLLRPDSNFLLVNHDGDVIVKDDLQTYTKYILYCYGRDNGIPNLLTQGPTFVRIDTYPPTWHLIDIVLEVPLRNFNDSFTRQRFLLTLRQVIQDEFDKTWIVKIERYRLDKDKFTVTIYALKDNSTYGLATLRKQKEFIHRNDLLGVLRKDFWGTPADEITVANFTEWMPIQVGPAYPIFWIDTIPGLVTIGLLCLLFIALVIGLTVGLTKHYRTGCFTERGTPRGDRMKIMPHPGDKDVGKQGQVIRKRRNREARAITFDNDAYNRRASIDTIHSYIYPKGRDIKHYNFVEYQE